MKFAIDKKVFEKFPTLFVALPIITGFDNSKAQEEAVSFMREAEAKLRQDMTIPSLWNDKRITAYLDCFKGFGMDPPKFVPAHLALVLRVLEGKNLPDINPMVNLYNAMSIKYLTPFGGENLDSLYGDFALKFARGGEQWIPIGGGKSKPAVAGELVWGDEYDLSTRALNWRQCDRTKMTPETQNGYFVMDGFSDVNIDNIRKAADEFVAVAVRLFGGEAKIYWLDKDIPSVEIPFSSKKMKLGITSSKSKSRIVKYNPIPDRKKQNDLPQLFQTMSWEGEETIGYKLKQLILRAIRHLAESREVSGDKLSLKLEDVKIEHPKQENYGDYSTNIALVLSGKLKMNPRDLAQKIAGELDKYIRQYQSRSSKADSFSHQAGEKSEKIAKTEPKGVGEMLETVSVAGPGFVNMTIHRDYLITQLHEVLEEEDGVIATQISIPQTGLPLQDKKILVEFAHPNTHKEFHIGHLRNISLGESIVRLLEGVGAQLFRANYEGDVGLHVAKAIWGVKKIMENRKLKMETLRELNPADKAKFLGEGYALGSQKYDEDKSIHKEIMDLNKAIYLDPKKVGLWEETRRWSLEYFDTVYHRVGSHFDRLFFESEVESIGKQIVKNNVQTGFFIKDKDGSIYFPGEKYGLNNCVFVTKEDYATYEGKEVALEELQRKTFTYDLSINNVANEQQNFFQLGYKATELLFPWHKGRHFHLAYGMVNFKTGKLSSRTGQVITADWLIDQAGEKIKKIMVQTSRKDTSGVARRDSPDGGGSRKEIDQIAEKVAVSAVKYAMLRVNPRMDIAFDIDESISFEGDSGPYLMYTYARCKSVIRKSKIKSQKSKIEVSHFPLSIINYQFNSEELILLRTLYRFPEVVTESAKTLSPHLLCGFLFDLAQKYNLFYNKHSILGIGIKNQESRVKKSDKDTSDGGPAPAGTPPMVEESVRNFRLVLTQATSTILSRGLCLLGIETAERM